MEAGRCGREAGEPPHPTMAERLQVAHPEVAEAALPDLLLKAVLVQPRILRPASPPPRQEAVR